MKNYICYKCGSENIHFNNCDARWNPVLQKMELNGIDMTLPYCHKCGEDTKAKEVEYIQSDPTQERIDRIVNAISTDVEKDGACRFDTCDHYNWDKFHWNHRSQIISKLREKGLSVKPITRYGVLEIHVSKK